jgi:hypothetical protein
MTTEAANETGTALYQRTIAADGSAVEWRELLKSEWSPTTWMINVQVDDKHDEMRHWCYHNVGRESSPMHGSAGGWKQASVTMHGRSWFGFRTELLMKRFQEHFGLCP